MRAKHKDAAERGGIMQAAQTEKDLRQEWRTPQDVFDLINREFRFEIDVAADTDNSKCARLLHINCSALSDDQRWFGPGTSSAWCNPPFKDMMPWIEKAASETRFRAGSVAVILCNYDPSTGWFMRARELCFEIRVMAGRRIQFDPPPGVEPSSNNKAQALLIFRRHPWGLACIERSWDWSRELVAND